MCVIFAFIGTDPKLKRGFMCSGVEVCVKALENTPSY